MHALAHPFASAGGDGLRPQRLQRVEGHRAERPFEPRARRLYAGDKIAGQRDFGTARAQLELGKLDFTPVRQDAAVGVPLIERHRRHLELFRSERSFCRAQLVGPRRVLGGALLLLRAAGNSDAAAAPTERRGRQCHLLGHSVVGDVNRASVDLEWRLRERWQPQAAMSDREVQGRCAHIAIARQLERCVAVYRHIERLQQAELRDRAGDTARHEILDRCLEAESAVAL